MPSAKRKRSSSLCWRIIFECSARVGWDEGEPAYSNVAAPSRRGYMGVVVWRRLQRPTKKMDIGASNTSFRSHR
jgi:hypothetical protein